MKRNMMTILTAALCALTLTACSTAALPAASESPSTAPTATPEAVSETTPEATPTAAPEAVSEATAPAAATATPAPLAGDAEAAMAIALTDAGVAEADATFTKAIQETDDGKTYFDVEFYTADAEYNYEIELQTGAILEKSVDTFDVNHATATPAGTIGVDRAKAIAAEHAGKSVDALTFTKAKLDRDDGRTVYEIEFYIDTTEHEYTIDAATGEILEVEVGD